MMKQSPERESGTAYAENKILVECQNNSFKYIHACNYRFNTKLLI